MQSRSRAHMSSLNNRIGFQFYQLRYSVIFRSQRIVPAETVKSRAFTPHRTVPTQSQDAYSSPSSSSRTPTPSNLPWGQWPDQIFITLHWKLTSYTLPCSRSLIWPEMFICAVRNLFILKHGANVHKRCLSLKRFWIVKPWAKSDIEAKLPKAATKLYLCFKSALRAQTFCSN